MKKFKYSHFTVRMQYEIGMNQTWILAEMRDHEHEYIVQFLFDMSDWGLIYKLFKTAKETLIYNAVNIIDN